MSKAVSKSQSVVQKVLKDMNPALQKLYYKAQEIETNLNKNDLIGHYKLGQEFNKLYDASAVGTYGTGAVEKIAVAMQRSRQYVDQARRFATTWTLRQVEDLIAAYQGHGATLTYTHMRLLMYVTDNATRDKLYDRCAAEALSTGDLDEIMCKLAGKEDAPRRMLAPRTVSAGLSQLNQMAVKLLERREVLTSKVFKAFDNMSAKEITDDLLDSMQKTRENIEELVSFLLDGVKAMVDAKEKATGIVQKKKEIAEDNTQITSIMDDMDTWTEVDVNLDDDDDDQYDDENEEDEEDEEPQQYRRRTASAHK